MLFLLEEESTARPTAALATLGKVGPWAMKHKVLFTTLCPSKQNVALDNDTNDTQGRVYNIPTHTAGKAWPWAHEAQCSAYSILAPQAEWGHGQTKHKVPSTTFEPPPDTPPAPCPFQAKQSWKCSLGAFAHQKLL